MPAVAANSPSTRESGVLSPNFRSACSQPPANQGCLNTKSPARSPSLPIFRPTWINEAMPLRAGSWRLSKGGCVVLNRDFRLWLFRLLRFLRRTRRNFDHLIDELFELSQSRRGDDNSIAPPAHILRDAKKLSARIFLQ